MGNRPGRPRIDPTDASVECCVTLPAKTYDELDARARRERVSIPELVRRALERAGRRHTRDDGSDGGNR